MPIAILLGFWKAEPFAPFEIKTSDGRVYSVDHPDFIARTANNRSIVVSTDDGRVVVLAMNQVVAIEETTSTKRRRKTG